MLIQLIYSFRSVLAANERQFLAWVNDRVHECRRVGIVGEALHRGSTCLHVMEGPAMAVETLFGVAVAEPALHRLVVHQYQPVERPQSMAGPMRLRRVGFEETLRLPDFAPFFEAGFDGDLMERYPGSCRSLLGALGVLPDEPIILPDLATATATAAASFPAMMG